MSPKGLRGPDHGGKSPEGPLADNGVQGPLVSTVSRKTESRPSACGLKTLVDSSYPGQPSFCLQPSFTAGFVALLSFLKPLFLEVFPISLLVFFFQNVLIILGT